MRKLSILLSFFILVLGTISASAQCSGVGAANTFCAAPNGSSGFFSPRAISGNDFSTISPTLTGNWIFNPASGDAITINPASATTAKGINITQTGPVTSPTGPVIYNLITVTNPASVTLPATLTNGMLNAEVRGFHVEMNDTSGTSVAVAGAFHMVANTGTPGGDKVAIIGNSYTNKNISGFVLGVDAVASSDVGTVAALVALQAETKIYGGTVTKRMGIDIDNYGDIRSATFDAALSISNYGTAPGAYQTGISYGSPGSIASISSTGDAILAQQAITIANFCNCANFTITGNIFNFQHAVLAADGTWTLTNNANTTFQPKILNNSAGATALAQWIWDNGTSTLTAGIGGTGFATALYQGRGYVTANGTNLVVGTSTSNDVLFAVNNVRVASLDVSTPGQLSLGVSGTTAGQISFVNATTGSIVLKPPTGALGTPTLTLPITTDTLSGKATVDIFTNKTYDTAGTGNVFKINGTTISAITGSGSVVLATSPSISGLTVTGSFTATGLVTNAALANPATTVAGQTCTLGSTCGLSSTTNSLSGDVALNAATYTTGPTVAQGTTGTWFSSGTITLTDTGAAPSVKCKLWDGTTVIASAAVGGFGAANVFPTLSLSGFLASPAANIRIDCINVAGTTGKILFNQSGNSKDSTLNAVRIN